MFADVVVEAVEKFNADLLVTYEAEAMRYHEFFSRKRREGEDPYIPHLFKINPPKLLH